MVKWEGEIVGNVGEESNYYRIVSPTVFNLIMSRSRVLLAECGDGMDFMAQNLTSATSDAILSCVAKTRGGGPTASCACAKLGRSQFGLNALHWSHCENHTDLASHGLHQN